MAERADAPIYWINGKNPYDVGLGEARAYADSVVLLDGDDGGENYLFAPVRLIHCSEETLQQLLRDIDAIEWPGQPEMAHIAFVRSMPDAPEQVRPGGLWQTTDVWVNEHLGDRGLEAAIRAVLAGERPAIT